MFTFKTPKQHILHRLKFCVGQLQAVERELKYEQECLKAVYQLQAVHQALQKVERLLIQDFLLKHLKSSTLLMKASKQVSSSSLHLSPSMIHQYRGKRRTV